MRALTWQGTDRLSVETIPDPEIVNPRDVIVRVTMSSVCGSDLHLLNGYVPTMKPGDVLGHEFLGEVVEVGSAVKHLKVGDRVALEPGKTYTVGFAIHDDFAAARFHHVTLNTTLALDNAEAQINVIGQ